MPALIETPRTSTAIPSEVHKLLADLGVPATAYTGGDLPARTPITGETLAHLPQITAEAVISAIARARHSREGVARRSSPQTR